MNVRKLVELAKGYRDLGNAVQDQLDQVLDGNMEACNPNALRFIHEWLEGAYDTVLEDSGGEDTELGEDLEGAIVELDEHLNG